MRASRGRWPAPPAQASTAWSRTCSQRRPDDLDGPRRARGTRDPPHEPGGGDLDPLDGRAVLRGHAVEEEGAHEGGSVLRADHPGAHQVRPLLRPPASRPRRRAEARVPSRLIRCGRRARALGGRGLGARRREDGAGGEREEHEGASGGSGHGLSGDPGTAGRCARRISKRATRLCSAHPGARAARGPTRRRGTVAAPVDLYQSLFHVARLLLSEDDGERTPEILFRHMLEATGAERGFIVVREGDTFEHRFDVRFGRDTVPRHVRSFSRSVVRRAIEARQMVVSPSLPDDPRFAENESVKDIGASAVIVAPLLHRGEVYGVVYLEYAAPVSAIPEDARRFIVELAEIAGSFLHRALEAEALRQRTQALERDLFARHDFAGIVTRHPKMIELLRCVAQVADSDATVLVGGETGTGKELIARALHVNSPRRAKPFVTLHTSALPGTVLESELFGHVKGAFTGADRDRAGRIASADSGTLFLDEVAEIAPEIQAKLLRFLQFGEIQRLGSDRTQKVDVRIVAATHQDLAAMCRAGRFREDLYFRLKVIELFIPPLRDRRSDIPLLVDHFVRRHWRRAGQEPRWSARAQGALAAYGYPGNVRELAHAVERACVLAQGPEMDVDLLPTEIAGGAAEPAGGDAFHEFTSDELEAAKAAALVRIEADFSRGPHEALRRQRVRGGPPLGHPPQPAPEAARAAPRVRGREAGQREDRRRAARAASAP